MMRAVVFLFIHLALSFAYKPSNHPYSKNELKTKNNYLRLGEDRRDNLEDAVRIWLQMYQLDPSHLRLKDKNEGNEQLQNNFKYLSPKAINKIMKYGVGSYLEYEIKFDENLDAKQQDVHKQKSNKHNAVVEEGIYSSEDVQGKPNLVTNGNKFTTEKQTKHTVMSDNDFDLSNEIDDEYSSDEDLDMKIIYITTPKPSQKSAELDDDEENFKKIFPNEHNKETYNLKDFYEQLNSRENKNVYFKKHSPTWLDFGVKKLRCKDKNMRQCDDDEIEERDLKERKEEDKKKNEKKPEKDKYADFYSKNPRVTVRPPWADVNYYFRTGLHACEPGSLSQFNSKSNDSSCRVCFCDSNGKIQCKIDEICLKQSIRSGTDLPPFCDHKMCFRQCLLTKMRAGACREDICTCL